MTARLDAKTPITDVSAREDVDKIIPIATDFGLRRRFFATISMACTILAKIVCPRPSPSPAYSSHRSHGNLVRTGYQGGRR
jgi:hypothetical protein